MFRKFSLNKQELYIKGGILMWIITVFSEKNIQMFEFDNQEEARATYKSIKGCKVISQVIYYNDFDIVELQ
jgi:hypothetical protein